MESVDVLIVGAGAAGLMAASAAATQRRHSVLVVDGAKHLGAKILVSGGGRCNVTHDVIDEKAYCGSSPAAIRRILRRFGVADTVAFFQALGVELKREETGKLFPTTDSARTVLDALLASVAKEGARIRHPFRVESLRRDAAGFIAAGPQGEIAAASVVLATGGLALPKSGSDGAGLRLARELGHSVTRTFPALVPLTLPEGHLLRSLPGITLPARLEVRSATGRRIEAQEGSLLLTHFGISGPVALDMSRHWQAARFEDEAAAIVASFLPGANFESLEADVLADETGSIGTLLSRRMPERLARALCSACGVIPATPSRSLPKELRRTLVRFVLEMPLPISGTRGYVHAELSAGGVPLAELQLATLESRLVPGLFLCGEILDVDGRIGGYNFQWAWASGFVAGLAAGT